MQTLITSYFPKIIRRGENDWEAYLDGIKVATFEFVEEHDGWWLAEANTDQHFQRRGIGSTIMKEAVSYYGRVFASRASQGEHSSHGGDDTRYLTQEGAALVRSCVRKRIMQPDWWFNPFMN